MITLMLIIVVLYSVPALWFFGILWMFGSPKGLKDIRDCFIMAFMWPVFVWGRWV